MTSQPDRRQMNQGIAAELMPTDGWKVRSGKERRSGQNRRRPIGYPRMYSGPNKRLTNFDRRVDWKAEYDSLLEDWEHLCDGLADQFLVQRRKGFAEGSKKYAALHSVAGELYSASDPQLFQSGVKQSKRLKSARTKFSTLEKEHTNGL